MHQRQLNRVTRHLRRAARSPTAEVAGDGELLERFVSCRDERAFADLVERHGPMVLGVCRRVTGDAHDADDAYQATFLVLVRRASAIRPREQVGNWLYGVACRTAAEARNRSARRRLHERPTDAVPQPAVEPAAPQDWRPILDQELQQLPAKYRAAVVLCELEGRPRREVARHLGVPEGTLSSRLAAARRLLADRLTRRGVAPSLAALALVMAREADAGGPVVNETISRNVIELTEGVVNAMTLHKMKLWAAAVAALVVVAGGGAMLSPGFGAGPQPPSKPGPALPAAAVGRALVPPPAPVQVEGLQQFQIDVSVVEVRNKERKLLTKPQIITLSGQAARINVDGRQQPLVEGAKIEYMPAGLQVTLTPTADDDGKVRIEAVIETVRQNQDEREPTWTTFTVRAIRRATTGKPIVITCPQGDPDGPVLETTLTVSELPRVYSELSPVEKEWKAAEFYRVTGHAGAARFHYELILRRYEDSPFAAKARERLKTLTDGPPHETHPYRVGMIQIVGNTKTPDGEILKRATLYPGAVLLYQDVQAAERNLAKIGAFKSPPKVMIRGVEDNSEFKDIRIIVEEK
ncbi:MAG: sigma-70 family RNA polymerase sigma factor [Gemmataceae bacterium]